MKEYAINVESNNVSKESRECCIVFNILYNQKLSPLLQGDKGALYTGERSLHNTCLIMMGKCYWYNCITVQCGSVLFFADSVSPHYVPSGVFRLFIAVVDFHDALRCISLGLCVDPIEAGLEDAVETLKSASPF